MVNKKEKTDKKTIEEKKKKPKIKVLTHELLAFTLSYLMLTLWWYSNPSNLSSRILPMSSLVFLCLSYHYWSVLLPHYEVVPPWVSVGYESICLIDISFCLSICIWLLGCHCRHWFQVVRLAGRAMGPTTRLVEIRTTTRTIRRGRPSRGWQAAAEQRRPEWNLPNLSCSGGGDGGAAVRGGAGYLHVRRRRRVPSRRAAASRWAAA
jgi:hypothetical protein